MVSTIQRQLCSLQPLQKLFFYLYLIDIKVELWTE
jgi:hypothetical protein